MKNNIFSNPRPGPFRLRLLILIFFILHLLSYAAFAQTEEAEEQKDNPLPLSTLFHEVGWNALRPFAVNYGANFAGAAFVTWASMASKADWEYRQLAFNNPGLSYAGIPSIYLGYAVPVLSPVVFYSAGRISGNRKHQIAGFALAQTALVSTGLSVIFKGITGLQGPKLLYQLEHKREENNADFSGNFKWGVGRRSWTAGWPSGHTVNAVAAAVVISEFYGESPLVKAGVWIYAAYIAFGVSSSVHWVSEVLAGALIGYAVGKTSAASFEKLLDDGGSGKNEKPLSFFWDGSPQGISGGIKFQNARSCVFRLFLQLG